MFAKSRLTAVLGLSVGLIVTSGALAQGVNNPGSLPNTFQTSIPPTGWIVIDPSGSPIPVSLNPSSNTPWAKNLTGPNNAPINYPAFAPPLTVQEVLQVAPTLPWTDWHEDVLNPGWVWANTPVVLVNNTQIFPTFAGVGTANLSMFFSPPLNVGDVVDIRKDLQYQGIPGTTFFGTLHINEYPTGTPEPASLGLLGIGGALLRRRRNRVA